MKFLKLALLGATFLAGAGALSAANAADMYARGGSLKDAPVDYHPAIWSGFYIGVNAGAAFDSGVDIVGNNSDDTTFIGGLHVGYNWQRDNNLVLGIEGDVDFADNVNYLATARGRLGWAAGPTLFYATGGAAFIDLDTLGSGTDNGWVAGLGIEHKVRENVSVGVEGLYYNFGNDRDFGTDDFNFWTVRARLTYHFGGRDDPLR